MRVCAICGQKTALFAVSVTDALERTPFCPACFTPDEISAHEYRFLRQDGVAIEKASYADLLAARPVAPAPAPMPVPSPAPEPEPVSAPEPQG